MGKVSSTVESLKVCQTSLISFGQVPPVKRASLRFWAQNHGLKRESNKIRYDGEPEGSIYDAIFL